MSQIKQEIVVRCPHSCKVVTEYVMNLHIDKVWERIKVRIKTSFWRSQIGDNERRARHFFSLKFPVFLRCIRSFIVCSRWKLVIFFASIKTGSPIQTTAVASSLYGALPGLLSDVSETKKLARTTWPETHRPGDLGSSTGCWRDLCFWPSIYDLLSSEVSCSN